MRDLRIYDIALNAAQIQALSTSAVPAKNDAAPTGQPNTPGEDVF
jgi:hypothetical protein